MFIKTYLCTKRISIRVLASLSILLCTSGIAMAHHSSSAYDNEGTMTVTGVVNKLQWRNPHVVISLEVVDANGNTSIWPLETAGLQQLIRVGWNKEVVGPGQKITAEIRPTIKGVPGGILRWVTLADGSVLAIDKDSPTGVQVADKYAENASELESDELTLQQKAALSHDDYLSRRSEVERLEAEIRPDSLPLQSTSGAVGALDPDNLAAHEGVAVYDFSGVWSTRSSREQSAARGGKPWHFLPVPELTAKTKVIQADVLARRAAGDATADPATLCYPHGLVRTMTRVGNMMLMQQNTVVYMVHRMNNDYRAIYWDGRGHVDPSVRVDSYNGDSIAYWNDDHLYVETVGFGSAFHYINEGIPIGTQGKIVERWRLINDGNTLEIEFRMTDPEHWVGEWIDTKLWDRIYGADIREANCILAEDGDLAIGGK